MPPMAIVATTADKATAVQFCVNSSALNVSSVIVEETNQPPCYDQGAVGSIA